MPRLHSTIIKFMRASNSCTDTRPSFKSAKSSINLATFRKLHSSGAHIEGRRRVCRGKVDTAPGNRYLFLWLFIFLATCAVGLAPSASVADAANVTLIWNPNTESDLAGYRVYYGTSSTNYSTSVDVGKTTQHTLTNLKEDTTYFFAITAYDQANNESTLSGEVSHTIPVPDSDGDGVPDKEDAFPLDPNETTDTDGDGTGNNADEDDDNDGMPDVWEVQYGLDPLVNDADEDADGDGISNFDEFRAGTDPTVYPGNRSPYIPELLLPNNGDYAALTPTLKIDAFQDPDFNDTHVRTQWEITRDADGVVVLDLTSSTALTSLEVPRLILDKATIYNWKASVYDNHGEPSEWSESFAFETENPANDGDGNGVPDHQEVDAGMDMDEDGTADIDQDTIKCITVESTNRHIGVSFKGSPTVLSIESLEYLDPDDPQIVPQITGMPESMPYGLISFKLIVDQPGDQATVTIYLSEPAPEGAVWYKYNMVDNEWQDYSAHAEFSADRRSVRLTFQDGGFGDADGIDNGIIVDPSGLGAASSVSSLGSSGGGGSSGGCFISSTAGGFSINQKFNALQIIGCLSLAAILLLLKDSGIFSLARKSVKA